jgi:hypothetical protein
MRYPEEYDCIDGWKEIPVYGFIFMRNDESLRACRQFGINESDTK